MAITRDIIDAIHDAGFQVYMREARDTWLYFTDGKRIGYLEVCRFGGVTRSTVQVPNKNSGAGFRLDDYGISVSELTTNKLSSAFMTAPDWASNRDRESIVKYRDFEAFNAAQPKSFGAYKLVA